MVAVGGVVGLYLQITPSNAKSWILRTTVGAKRRDIGQGSFPDVSLAQAKERARHDKEKIRQGIDPIEERNAGRLALAAAQARRLTFRKAAEGYASATLRELGSESDRIRWRSSIERYVLPRLGDMEVSDLATRDIVAVLQPIWHEKTETASRVRARIEAILAWATVAGHRSGENPARWRGNLDQILPRPSKIKDKNNHPALAIKDAAAWFAALRERNGVGAKALQFLSLCASRSGEVRGVTWDEIDLANAIWTIPAERMKADREHVVPLSTAAIEIIQTMPRREDSSYVFAGSKGGMISDMTLSKVMRDMQNQAQAAASKTGEDPGMAGWRDPRSGRPAVPHGLRSTFRDWVGELTVYPREMGEIALAHQVGSDVERAYRRGSKLEKRRRMMTDWAEFLGAE